MGILNVTTNSFYAESRLSGSTAVARRVMQMLEEGVDIIDVGAFSTRPGCSEISVEEELRRLSECLGTLRKIAPDVVVSVDTFRARVAEKAITEMGADIVNDISGSLFDDDMLPTVARLKVPYILTHSMGKTLSALHEKSATEDILPKVLIDIAKKVSDLTLMGVNDIILDPGFGFGKNIKQNYQLLNNLEFFSVFHLPVLAGVSRKSMITRLLDIAPEDALTGTTVLNTIALNRGASILRVHDVKAAKETIKIHDYIQSL